MKYIRSFESVYPRRDLQQFCKDYLSNIVDTFGTRIVVVNKIDYYEVSIDTLSGGTWKDIKDDFIPFFYILDKNYKILNLEGRRCIKLYGVYFTKNSVLNDKIEDRSPIGFISMHIKKDT